MAAPTRAHSRRPRRSSSHFSSTIWELELQAGGYRSRTRPRSLVPHAAAALNFHGRALVEESNRSILNNILSQTWQNTPLLPPNSRLQLEQHSLQLRDYQNTPRLRDSVVQHWRGDYETGDHHRNTDCDRFVTQARNRVDPLLPPTRRRNPQNPNFDGDESDESDEENVRLSPDDTAGYETEEDRPIDDAVGSGQTTSGNHHRDQESSGEEEPSEDNRAEERHPDSSGDEQEESRESAAPNQPSNTDPPFQRGSIRNIFSALSANLPAERDFEDIFLSRIGSDWIRAQHNQQSRERSHTHDHVRNDGSDNSDSGDEQASQAPSDGSEQEDPGTSGSAEAGDSSNNEEAPGSDSEAEPIPGWTRSHPTPTERAELQRRGEEAQEARRRSGQHSPCAARGEESQ
ncbi:hypothetical protein VMCG_03728 [Cytospora schulzeri]|uniref:Uncharacterized protein n=1 Tax=Cytospora schulzeri TaxID=448051 RepID=A0A423WVE5_9PEZI|nr:hypothetical protein VMCG_03728 [Valsa malicola]